MADARSAGAHDAHPAQKTRDRKPVCWFEFPDAADELPYLLLAAFAFVALVGAVACWGPWSW